MTVETAARPGLPVLDNLAAARWVEAYNAAWVGRDWVSLASYLAPGVEFVVPALGDTLSGRPAIIATLRDSLANVVIHEYDTTNLAGHDHGSVGVITYDWQLDSSIGQQHIQSTGRDVLVLSATAGQWLLVWRGQFSI
jgi:hypothetical protein